MSLKTELEAYCRHPQGYFYVQDANGSYHSPVKFLISLSPEILNARYGFRSTGGHKEYWVYKDGLYGSKEEFVFRTYVPEGRWGWATDFEETKASQTHYYGEKSPDAKLVSLCGKHKRADNESALFVLNPPANKVCKQCLKKLQSLSQAGS